MDNLSIENNSPLAREPLNKEEIVKQVIELQKNWNKYVTEQTPEFIGELYEKNLLRFEADAEGKIIAVLYIQPLDSSLSEDDLNQIFRIGGLARSSSKDSKEATKRILQKLKTEVLEKNMNIIAKTDNPALSEYLKNIGMEELPYEKCKEKYPKFLELYLKESKKTTEEYSSKMFYVKTNSK